MHTLSVLLNERDWSATETIGGPPGLPLVFDYALHARLTVRRVAHLTPGDVLPPDYPRLLQQRLDAAWAFWTRHAHATYRHYDLLHFAPYRHYEALARLVWCTEVVERALARVQPARVAAFCEPTGHALWHPSPERFPPLGWIARFLAETTGRAFDPLHHPAPRSASAALPADLRAAHQPGRVDLITTLARRPYVLLQANYVDLLRQKPLVEELLQRNDCAVVQVYSAADAQTLADARCGQLLIHETEAAPTNAFVLDGYWREFARNAFRAAAARVAPPLQPLFHNRHLAPHWDFIFGDYLLRLAWHAEVWPPLLRAAPPAAVVVQDRTPLADLAAAHDIPVLTLPHGVNTQQRPWTRLLLPTRVALGDQHAERLRRWCPESEPFVGGSPTVDAWLERAKTVPDADARAAARAQLTLPRDAAVLLVVTANPGTLAQASPWPTLDYRRYTRLLQSLVELQATHPRWRIVIKVHPRFDAPDAYRALLAPASSAAPAVRVETAADLATCTLAADALVFPADLSSALFEASLLRRPAYVLREALRDYDAQAWAVHRWPQLNSVADLAAEFAAILRDPDLRDARAAAARAAAHAHFAPLTPSAPRCAVWLSKQLDVRTACAAATADPPTTPR